MTIWGNVRFKIRSPKTQWKNFREHKIFKTVKSRDVSTPCLLKRPIVVRRYHYILQNGPDNIFLVFISIINPIYQTSGSLSKLRSEFASSSRSSSTLSSDVASDLKQILGSILLTNSYDLDYIFVIDSR